MASCRVNRNNQGDIQKVMTSSGTESVVYKSIVKHPLVENTEQALDLYKNIFTGKLNTDERTIEFSHRVNRVDTTSYREALKNSKEGEEIQIGFKQGDTFVPLITTVKNTNKETEKGYINNLIENELLSEERGRVGNNYYLRGEGYTSELRIASVDMIIQNAYSYMGVGGVTRAGEYFTRFEKTKNKTQVILKDGTGVEVIDERELDTLSYEELQEKYENAEEIIAEREYYEALKPYRDTEINIEKPATISERDLQIRLLNFLNKLGIKVVSISNYVNSYTARNGVHPSAKALADIANQVIAVQNGEISIDTLTEEVAHFINEAMPQEQVENILRNIHRSEEYKQYYDIYKDIYSSEYANPQDLENAIRREILGKIVANSLQSNFSVEERTETQQNFIQRALDIVRQFFQNVSNYFKPEYNTELDAYLQNVEEVLNSEDIASEVYTDNFKNNKYRLYQVERPSNLYKKLDRLNKSMQDQIRTLLKKKQASKTDLATLASLEDKFEKGQVKQGVLAMLDIMDHNINKLNASVSQSEKQSDVFFMSAEESIVLNTLYSKYRPMLEDIKSDLTGKEYDTSDWNTIKDRIDQTSRNVGDVRARIDKFNDGEKLVNHIIDKYGIDPSYKAHLRQFVDRAKNDTAWVHATFGQLIHARDGMLNLVSILLKNMNTEAETTWQNSTKELQDRLRELGVTEQDLDQFVEESGQYYLSEYNQQSVQELRDAIAYNEYKKIEKGYSEGMSLEDFLRKRKNNELEFSEENRDEYFRNVTNEERKFQELRHTSEYYTEFEERLENKESVTRAFLKGIYQQQSYLKQKATIEEGGKRVFNLQSLSPQDIVEWARINRQLQDAKSYYDATGELRKGLSHQLNPDGSIVLDDKGRPIVSLNRNTENKDAIVAYELNEIDKEYFESASFEERNKLKGQMPQLFLDMLQDVDDNQGREEALKFLELNSYIGFTSEFWDSLGGSKTISDKLQEAADNLLTEEDAVKAIELKNKITIANRKLRSVLKKFQRKNRPAEIDILSSDVTTRGTIIELQEELEGHYREARVLTKDVTEKDTTQMSSVTSGENSANDSYLNYLREQNLLINENDSIEEQRRKINGEYEYARNHMTSSNKESIGGDIAILGRIGRGESANISRSMKNTLDALDMTEDSLSNEESRIRFTEAHIRSKLAAYYRRFSPTTYNSFFDLLRNENINISEAIEQASNLPGMEITPNYSFFDQSSVETLNPNFDENYKGGFFQPKKGVHKYNGKNYNFTNTKYEELFGNITTNEDGTKISSKNNTLFQAYTALMEYKFESDEKNGLSQNNNSYLLPQIRRQTLERATKFIRKPNIKSIQNAFRELTQFTEDDMEMGDQTYGSAIKIVPTRYVNRLDNPEDISSEVFFSSTLYAKEANLREARTNYVGDFLALENQILNREYQGKGAEAAQTKKMLRSAMDDALFGIREERNWPINTPFGTVDVAKIGRVLLSALKFRNLGLNVIIPLTSYVTAKVSQKIETLAEENINKRSFKLGSSVYNIKVKDGMSEMGKINTKAEINALGQFFGAFDLEDSFRNSSYGWFSRVLARTPMGLHAAANYPIYGKNMYGVLHDYRFIDGKLTNFVKFRQEGLVRGLSNKEIKDKWNESEEKAIYQYINVNEDGTVSYNRGKIKNELGITSEEELSKQINDINFNVRNTLTLLNEYTDLQLSEEDRLYAQRDFLLNYLMTHRGWFSITASRRFKYRNFNLASGQYEEGTYRTAANFIGDTFKEWRARNFGNILKVFKDEYKKLPELTAEQKEGLSADEQRGMQVQLLDLKRRNLKRIGIEMAMLHTVALVSLLLRSAAEDEDNKDLFALQLSNLVMYRTLNEVSSTQFGLVDSVNDIVEAPFVGWNTVKDISKVYEVFNTEEISRGLYKDYTKGERHLIRLIPGAKQARDLGDLSGTYGTYKYFNKSAADKSLIGMADNFLSEE